MKRRLECDWTAFARMKHVIRDAEENDLDPSIAALHAFDIDPPIGDDIDVVVCLKDTPVFPMGQAFLVPPVDQRFQRQEHIAFMDGLKQMRPSRPPRKAAR